MLRSVSGMRGFTIYATDGDMGAVDEFLFDDEHLSAVDSIYRATATEKQPTSDPHLRSAYGPGPINQ